MRIHEIIKLIINDIWSIEPHSIYRFPCEFFSLFIQPLILGLKVTESLDIMVCFSFELHNMGIDFQDKLLAELTG